MGHSDGYPPFGLREADAYSYKVRRRAIRGYGWRPDQPDHRDQIYTPPEEVHVPESVDLQSKCPPVYSQGALGSCTANAIAAAVQYARMRQNLRNASATPSRLFVYFGERVIEGTVDTDSGASLRDGIKVVAADGACFESGRNSWPYDVHRFTDRPPQDCFGAAAKDLAVSYSRLRQNAGAMEACLAEGFPFVFGFAAFEVIESAEVAADGILPLPHETDRPIGGHAVMAVGYDRQKKKFKLRNSWGAGWGQEGYFWMPYDYVASPKYSGDFWTIRLVEKGAGKRDQSHR
jgi:C1A family cysteine protease